MASFVTNHLEQYLPEYTLPLYVKPESVNFC